MNKTRLRSILAAEMLTKKATPDEVVAKVIVRSGRSYDYDREEIQEMLDDKRMYQNSDNLPKWLFMSGRVEKVRGMPTSWRKVWDIISRLVKHQGRPVVINVQSDDRSKNGITGLRM